MHTVIIYVVCYCLSHSFTDCSIREYQSVFLELEIGHLINMLALCWHSTSAYYAAYLTQVYIQTHTVIHILLMID